MRSAADIGSGIAAKPKERNLEQRCVDKGLGKMPIILGFLAGVGLPIQTSVNTRLRKKVGSPFNAALVSFLVGLLFLSALLLVTGQGPHIPFTQLLDEPTWILIGGICGVVFLTGNILLFPKLDGAGASRRDFGFDGEGEQGGARQAARVSGRLSVAAEGVLRLFGNGGRDPDCRKRPPWGSGGLPDKSIRNQAAAGGTIKMKAPPPHSRSVQAHSTRSVAQHHRQKHYQQFPQLSSCNHHEPPAFPAARESRGL